MNKFCIFSISFFFLAGSAFSQLEIKRSSGGGVSVGSDLAGTEVLQTVTTDGLHAYKYNVINLGDTAIFSVVRKRLEEVVLWHDGLCWAPVPDLTFEGTCYGSSVMPTNPWTTPTGVTIPADGIGEIIIDITTEGVGTGLYRYTFLNGSTAIDSIDLRLTQTLSIDEKEDVSISTYPNPAVNNLTIKTAGLDGDISIKIADVLGKVVFNQEVNTPKKLDVSDFKNGVYVVSVYNDGVLVQNKRVVIKH